MTRLAFFGPGGLLHLLLVSLLLGPVTGCRNDALRDVGFRTLTRADYRLTPGLARDVAAFLNDQLTVELETRVVGDTLTVTTSKDAQRTIRDFLGLLESTPTGVLTGGYRQSAGTAESEPIPIPDQRRGSGPRPGD